MTAKMRRPPPGGIAGAAEARLRGVEPDVNREAARRTLHLHTVYPLRPSATQSRRAHLIGSLRAAAPMLSVVDRSAAFFDLDKTIIARSSALAFGRPFRAGGLINRRAALKAAYAQLVYLVAGADEDQMTRMRDYVTEMCTGWDVQQVKEIVAETLFDIVDPLIYAEAADLIEEHKAAGREVVIVSSSGEEVVAPIGELVGADRVIATRMVVEDGRYTGEVAFYAYGPAKAQAMRELAEAAGYDLADCYAYSDSSTDLPMLEAVGHPTAVNPDRALRRAARERDWPVLVFNRPVSLRARLASLRTPRRPVVSTAVGVGAAVVGLAWYASRRRSAGPAPEQTGRRRANETLVVRRSSAAR
jgi:HAD superfamily hydrolase (TIGR01490 family)